MNKTTYYADCYTIPELVEKTGLSKWTINGYIKTGQLRAYDIGEASKHRWIVHISDWEEFKERSKKGEILKALPFDRSKLRSNQDPIVDEAPVVIEKPKPVAVIKEKKDVNIERIAQIKEKISDLQVELINLAEEIDDILQI